MRIGKKLNLIGAFAIINPTFTLIIIVLLFIVTPIHIQSFKYNTRNISFYDYLSTIITVLLIAFFKKKVSKLVI